MSEIVVLITTSSEDEATRIAKALVEARVAACANILPRIRSIFRWEGKTQEEDESLIVVKSQSQLFEQLSHTIKELHSYTVPEIIALPITDGLPEYLQWVKEETQTKTSGEK